MEQGAVRQVAATEPAVKRGQANANVVASYNAKESSVYSVIPEERATLRTPAPTESVYDTTSKGTVWR